MQTYPVEKYKNMFSDKFNEVIFGDYFSNEKIVNDEVTYADISHPIPRDIYLMRKINDAQVKQDFEASLTEDQRIYRRNGCLIKRNFIPDEIIDRYMKLRERLNLKSEEFDTVSNYVEYKPVRDIACYPPLTELLSELHSAAMGLIFTLTKFKTTQRGWHQDSYLDHDDALPRLAVWIACGDITADAGPFEYLEGSHSWNTLSNMKVNNFLKEEYHWPKAQRQRKPGVLPWGRIAEAFVDPAVHKEINSRNLQVKPFLAQKGDVLIWYGRLMHRGSRATNPQAERPALIGHYAPVFERDRGVFMRDQGGGYFLYPPAKYGMIDKYTS